MTTTLEKTPHFSEEMNQEEGVWFTRRWNK